MFRFWTHPGYQAVIRSWRIRAWQDTAEVTGLMSPAGNWPAGIR